MTTLAMRAIRPLGLAATAAAAALAIAPAPAGAAAGNPTSCSASTSVTPPVRAEGRSERVGDIALMCSGGPPTGMGIAVPPLTLTVFLNTPTTSSVLADPWDEALLLVDEPSSGLPGAPTTQLACQSANGECSLQGNDTGVGQYNGSAGHPNVFQGQVSAGTVTFANVPIDSLGPNTQRVLRIVNLRADASGLGSVGPVPPAITAVLAFDSGGPSIANNTPTVGFVQPASSFSARTADGSAPLSAPTDLPSCATGRAASLRFAELFGTAFKPRTNDAPSPSVPVAQNVPGTVYNSESGFFNPSLVGNAARGNLGLAGLAASGTRVKAVFEHVPAGASLFVPTSFSGPGTTLQLVPAEAGPYSAVAPGGAGPAGTAPVALAGGTGTAVWEIVKSNPNGLDTLDVPVYAAAGTAAGTITVSQGLAPVAAAASAPSFAAGGAAVDMARLRACSAGPGSVPASSVVAKISSAKILNKRFRVGRSPTAILARKAPVGTSFRFSLAAPAKLTIAITRRASGLRSGKRCVAPTGKLRRHHAKRCRRTVTVGTLTRANQPAGAGSVAFSGRIGRRALKPGGYKAVLGAVNTKGRSPAVTLAFTIVR